MLQVYTEPLVCESSCDVLEELITALTYANRLRNEENDLLAAFLRRNTKFSYGAVEHDENDARNEHVKANEQENIHLQKVY